MRAPLEKQHHLPGGGGGVKVMEGVSDVTVTQGSFRGVEQSAVGRRQGRRHGFSTVGARFPIYIVHCVLAEFQWGQ